MGAVMEVSQIGSGGSLLWMLPSWVTKEGRTYSPSLRRLRFKEAHASIPRWDTVPLFSKEEIRAKYEFGGGTIGQGAEGVVLRGYQLGTVPLVHVAAKLITIAPQFIPYALVESKILASTNHAAVPLVIDLFRDEDYIYIIQEFVPGKALFEVLLSMEMSEDECKLISFQLLDLLDYLHTQGTIHCDIKPENIIYDRSTHKVYLLDFGSAKKFGASSQCITGGTIGYFAPEVIQTASGTSAASDVWAMGVLLFTLLSRHPPFFSDTKYREDDHLMESAPFWFFNNEDSVDLRREIAEGFVDVDHLSSQAGDLLQSMLEVDPQRRITAKQALTHPWFEEVPFLCAKLDFSRVLRDVRSSGVEQ